jgi:hypothetical protein
VHADGAKSRSSTEIFDADVDEINEVLNMHDFELVFEVQDACLVRNAFEARDSGCKGGPGVADRPFAGSVCYDGEFAMFQGNARAMKRGEFGAHEEGEGAAVSAKSAVRRYLSLLWMAEIAKHGEWSGIIFEWLIRGGSLEAGFNGIAVER